MSRNETVNQLKQKYRTRYFGNRVQAIPDLKPGDNALSFVNNYLNVTASNSDCEDHEEQKDSRRLFSEGRLRTQQNPANYSSVKSRVHDTPQRSQGGGNSVTHSDPSKICNAIKKNVKQPDLTKLFSDDESDDEGRHLVARLIEEEGLADNQEIVDGKLVNKVEKPGEKVYSSDTSVVQEPTSPTDNIHARKWLSFKNSTHADNINVVLNQVARLEEFTNNARQLKQLEASNSIKKNLHHADITHDLLTASSANGSENEFVIEEENSCNFDAWVTPLKKKKLSPPKRQEGTPTPKKANSKETFSSLQKKSKNMKASLISSTTAERLSSKACEAPTPSHAVNSNEEEFEIEDLSELSESNLFTIPVKAKSTQTGLNKKEKAAFSMPCASTDKPISQGAALSDDYAQLPQDLEKDSSHEVKHKKEKEKKGKKSAEQNMIHESKKERKSSDTRKRNAKLRNNCPPYPADHDKEESVFQSGPVTRQTRAFVGSVKPIAYDLEVPDTESGAEEDNRSAEGDEPIVCSGEKPFIVEHFVGGRKTDAQILEAKRELLKRCSIVFDPDTESDALIECIVQSEMSTFLGDESCKYWSTFNNSIFSTGKMIIAPKKKSERCVFLLDIVVYYVEKGKVQLNLHKSEQILKDGDFFFVPPGWVEYYNLAPFTSMELSCGNTPKLETSMVVSLKGERACVLTPGQPL